MMRCPFCKSTRTQVVDSREGRTGDEIRRRRVCSCGRRFTTFERLERRLPTVIKKDEGRVPFDREKVRNGVLRATWKRRIREDQIDDFLNDLERDLSERFPKEVSTKEIADEVLKFLIRTDPVAYVRFQSVYGDFKSVDEFKKLISELTRESR